jgi:hypothetical protein
MQIKDIVDWIGKHLWTIIILVSVFIQITPIKLNPWSSLFKWIGKMITNNACSKIDGLILKVGNLESTIDANEKDRIRWEILDFANSCRNDRKHSRDEF